MEYAKFISVMFASTIKFVGGPIAGLALGLNFWQTVFCSAAGMMFTICLVLFASDFINWLAKKFQSKNKKIFTKTKRFVIFVKQKFGLLGIALLTPFLLSPIGGGLLALAFKYKKPQILVSMLGAAFFGGVIQTAFFFFLPTIKTYLF